MNFKILSLLLIFSINLNAQNKKIKLVTSDNATIIIPIKDNTSLSVETSTGDVLATTSSTQAEFSASLGGSCSTQVQPNAPTVTLSSTNNSVNPGGSTTINYTIGSVNATKCSKSGAWSGDILTTADLTIGTHSIPLSNLQTTSTYSMRCYNGTAASSLVSTTVTVNTQTGNCPAPVNGISSIQEDHDPENFTDLNSVSSWPGSSAASEFFISRGHYIALKFNTGNNNLRATWQALSPNLRPPANTTIAISKCPGVFNADLGAQCYFPNTGSFPHQIAWSTYATDPVSFKCVLNKNEDYYINIIHADPADFSTSQCVDWNTPNCAVLVSTNVQ